MKSEHERWRMKRFLAIKYPNATEALAGSKPINRVMHFVVWTKAGNRYAFGCLSTQTQGFLSQARVKQLDTEMTSFNEGMNAIVATSKIENVTCRLCLMKIRNALSENE